MNEGTIRRLLIALKLDYNDFFETTRPLFFNSESGRFYLTLHVANFIDTQISNRESNLQA